MSKRIRLTSRARRAESISDGIFPGDIGNPDRKKVYRKMDEYHTFEPSLNHWTPDMRDEWKKDKERDSVGLGIPRVAKVAVAAQNAIKLAMMLLGDGATEKQVEAQAKDFMRLGNARLVASIRRWEASDDEGEAKEEKAEEKPKKKTKKKTKKKVAPTDEALEKVEGEAVDVDEGDETVDDVTDADSDDDFDIDSFIDEALADTEGDDDFSDEEYSDDDFADVDIAEPADEAEIDFGDDSGGIEINDAEADIEKVFDEDFGNEEGNAEETVTEEVAEKPAKKKKEARKQGVKTLGKPRLASRRVDELEGLWSDLDVPKI